MYQGFVEQTRLSISLSLCIEGIALWSKQGVRFEWLASCSWTYALESARPETVSMILNMHHEMSWPGSRHVNHPQATSVVSMHTQHTRKSTNVLYIRCTCLCAEQSSLEYHYTCTVRAERLFHQKIELRLFPQEGLYLRIPHLAPKRRRLNTSLIFCMISNSVTTSFRVTKRKAMLRNKNAFLVTSR